jgi:PAS domain S-box-containing protein
MQAKAEDHHTPLSNAPCEQILSEWCETASDAIIVCNNRGVVQFANHHTEQIFGIVADQLIGQPVESFIPALGPDGYPLKRPPFELMSHMVTGQHKTGPNIPLEISLTSFKRETAPMQLILIRRVERAETNTPHDNPLEKLSPREYQIVELVVTGYTSREIAEQLTISIKTVERHRANIMYKLEINNVVQLVRLAMKNGIR